MSSIWCVQQHESLAFVCTLANLSVESECRKKYHYKIETEYSVDAIVGGKKRQTINQLHRDADFGKQIGKYNIEHAHL